MPMKKLCIDIDNVLAQSDSVMRQLIKEHSAAGVQLDYCDIVDFAYWKCRDKNGNSITKDEWVKIHEEFSKEGNIMSIEPIPGACEYLKRLSDEGYELHLATSRLDTARIPTIKWLKLHSFPNHWLHFVKSMEKHVVLQGFDAIIEDEREQAAKFAELGTQAFLLAHPWNEIPHGSQIIRVENWRELYNKIRE